MNGKESFLTISPHKLFVSKLPNGEKEFFCFICCPNARMGHEKHFSWRIISDNDKKIVVSGERSITDKEYEQHRIPVSAILSTKFEGGELSVDLPPYKETWRIDAYNQESKFQLPLKGQILVVSSHRIGEPHRSAQISSQQFGWDFLPFHNYGLRLLKRSFSENLRTQDFEAFGQSIITPADGTVVKAVDGSPDITHVGELPNNLDYYREDLTRAFGNHVIIDHGKGVWSFLAHFKNGSVQVSEGQEIEVSDKLGELGNSGFSSGPHVHLHFMNGPDVLSASPLPIELDLEGGMYAPQAGEITSSLR